MQIFTDSTEPLRARLTGLAISAGPVGSWYVPLTGESGIRTPEQQTVIEGLKPWLEGKARKVAHSAKFVLHVMANEGIRLLAPGAGRLDDTRLEDYVLESHNRHELERLSLRWLHRDIPGTEEVFGKGASKKATHEVEPEKAARCGVEQAAAIRTLHARFTMKLAEDPGQKLTSIYEEIELPTERVLFRMERTGTLIDTELLHRQSKALGKEIEKLEEKAWS